MSKTKHNKAGNKYENEHTLKAINNYIDNRKKNPKLGPLFIPLSKPEKKARLVKFLDDNFGGNYDILIQDVIDKWGYHGIKCFILPLGDIEKFKKEYEEMLEEAKDKESESDPT